MLTGAIYMNGRTRGSIVNSPTEEAKVSPSSEGTHPAIRAILDRRSVREGFTGREVPRDVLAAVVACGLAAPSSKNAQPWRLHVVSDRQVREEIATAAVAAEGADSYTPRDPVTGMPWPNWTSTVDLSAGVLRDCGAAIFVENLGEFSRGRGTLATVPRSHLVGSLVGYTFEVLGIGMAIENMWVAAAALGLGGSYLGDIVIVEELVRERLGLRGGSRRCACSGLHHRRSGVGEGTRRRWVQQSGVALTVFEAGQEPRERG